MRDESVVLMEEVYDDLERAREKLSLIIENNYLDGGAFEDLCDAVEQLGAIQSTVEERTPVLR